MSQVPRLMGHTCVRTISADAGNNNKLAVCSEQYLLESCFVRFSAGGRSRHVCDAALQITLKFIYAENKQNSNSRNILLQFCYYIFTGCNFK